MADSDDAEGRQTARRTKPSRKTSLVPDNDWPRRDEPAATSSPRRRLHGDIDSWEIGTISSSARRRPGSTAKVPTTPTRSPLTRASSMSARNPSAAAPGLSRAATISHRQPAYIYDDEDNSRSDSRRSRSRRDVSPRSAHLYRSMPGSRRSSRTSLSEPDADTDFTSSTEDERTSKHGKALQSKHIAPQPLPSPPPRVPRPPRSRRDVIYEEDDIVESRGRRPRLMREETLYEADRERERNPRAQPRAEELLYPQDSERECKEPRSRPRRGQVAYDVDCASEILPRARHGEVIYEEDCETTPKDNPFLDGTRTLSIRPSRASSRAPTHVHESYPSDRKAGRRSSTVIDEALSRSRSRHRPDKKYASHWNHI